VTLPTVERGGPDEPCFRVADPDWADPLDGGFAARHGGRWNPPGSFPVVYLNADVATARRNVDRLLAGQPYGPEDLDPAEAYILVEAEAPRAGYVDVVTAAGLRACGLPESYPRDADGAVVDHATCRPIGVAAHEAGLPGIACRSAAPGASDADEELACFVAVAERRRWSFEDWYWSDPA
jgi:RES domain-containing protein